MMKPTFVPYLFDSRDAWEKTVTDPRWNRDMPFDEFMSLYRYYRNGYRPIQHIIEHKPEPATIETSTLLTQSEIDAMIDLMMPTKESTKKVEMRETPKSDADFSGLLNQSDIDALFTRM